MTDAINVSQSMDGFVQTRNNLNQNSAEEGILNVSGV